MEYVGKACAVASGLAAIAVLLAGCGAPSATRRAEARGVAAVAPRRLPVGVTPRATILARYRSTLPGVTTQAKLVSIAALDRTSEGELTQCQFRGCAPGALVWLVLEKGRPGTFAVDMGFHASTPSAGSSAWSLAPIDAMTGQARGDSESGPLSQLSSSPWGQLRDLAAIR